MSNSYKLLNALFLGCMLVLGSCSKDEEVAPVIVDTPEGVPTIQITEPFSEATVKGTTTVKVSVKLAANSTLDKVVVSIDDVVLKEFKETTISLDWDTRTVANGAHAIRVSATTVSGKNAQTSIGVKVDNVDVLVDLDLPRDYLMWEGGGDAWFFASDEKGNLIDVIKVQRNAHNILARKNGFKGDTFTLTGVYIYSQGIAFCTMADFKAGAYKLPSWNDLPSSSTIGNAAITFTGHTSSPNTYRYTSGSSSMNIENGAQTYRGSLFTNPASYLYSHAVSNGIEYVTGDISIGDDLTRSVSVMTLMDKQEITFAKGTTASISANGNRDDGFYNTYYTNPASGFAGGSRKKEMYYPGSFFKSYNLQLSSYDVGLTYGQYLVNIKTLPTAMSYLDCSTDGFHITGNNYKIGIQGTCDYVYSSSSIKVNDKVTLWRVWTAPNAELVIPKIPDMIRNAFSDVREYNELTLRNQINMIDDDEMDGYAGFVKAPRGFMDFVVDYGWHNWRYINWFVP